MTKYLGEEVTVTDLTPGVAMSTGVSDFGPKIGQIGTNLDKMVIFWPYFGCFASYSEEKVTVLSHLVSSGPLLSQIWLP